MKLKTRIIVGFVMIILVPLLLFAATCTVSGTHRQTEQPDRRKPHCLKALMSFP